MRARLAWFLFTVTLLTQAVAWSHGGRPKGRGFFTDPIGDEMLAVISNDLGLHVSLDEGQSWYWICEDVVGYDVYDFALAGPVTGTPEDRVWLAGGVGITDEGEIIPGLYFSEGGGCDWEPVGGVLAEQWISALSVDPMEPNVVIATSWHKERANGIARSEDAGRTWAWTSIEPMEGREFKSLVRAPSDPSVLYASSEHAIWSSTDGGLTWASFGEEIILNAADEMRVHAVDPEDPLTLYFSALQGPGHTLYVTRDGGASYQVLYLPPTDFVAFGLQPQDGTDARLLVLGSSFGDGFRSTDGGETWEEYFSEVIMECLLPVEGQPGAFWMCSNPFIQFGQERPFAIGLTTDQGETVDPYFSYGDTTDYRLCELDSQICEVCAKLDNPDVIENPCSIDGPPAPDMGPEPDMGSQPDTGPDPDMGAEADMGQADMGQADDVIGGGELAAKDDDCGCVSVGGQPRAPWWPGLVSLLGVALRFGRSRLPRPGPGTASPESRSPNSGEAGPTRCASDAPR